MLQLSCSQQVNDIRFIQVKHHSIPNIIPNFTQSIRNTGKEGEYNQLGFDIALKEFVITDKLDANSHYEFVNIEDDIQQIKIQDKYMSINDLTQQLTLTETAKEDSKFRVVSLNDKMYKISLVEELTGGTKQISWSNSMQKVELSATFGELQTWEVDFVNMKLENVKFELDTAVINKTKDNLFKENQTNVSDVKVHHEFVFDKEISDIQNLKPIGGFKLTKDRLIETFELKINTSELSQATPNNSNTTPPITSYSVAFNNSKPLQLSVGENKISNPINLTKSLEVNPKREVESFLEVEKYDILVDMSMAIVDKVTNQKFHVGMRLSIKIFKSPKIKFEHISEEVNCQYRGRKSVKPNGDVQCECDLGFEGKLCETPLCDLNCNFGTCQVQVTENNSRIQSCLCNPDQMGDDCQIPQDKIRFEGKQICKGHKCICTDEFQGDNCTKPLLPSWCNNHGTLTLGKCQCDDGWYNSKCDCNIQCYNHGICRNNECQCAPGYVGHQCETRLVDLVQERTSKLCMNDCSGEGVCAEGVCNCKEGFQGLDCSCTQPCKNGGICTEAHCKCPRGFYGSQCEFLGCKMNCSGNGECVEGRCKCYKDFTGETCETPTCDDNCNGHGSCVVDPTASSSAICKCNSGYSGPSCTAITCGIECTANGGMCKEHETACMCPSNRTGVNCKVTQCKNGCNGNGYCTENNECLCTDIYEGEDCSKRICKNNCSGNGECILPEQHCNCNALQTEADCSMKKCPNDCNLKGSCNQDDGYENPKCECDVGYMGDDCSKRQCQKDCNQNGNCMAGVCQCNQYWQGDDCSEFKCPYDCNHNGICGVGGKCACNPGYAGEQCENKTCPNSCSGRGRCLNGECQCDAEYSGTDCSLRACPNNCNGNGDCEQDNGNPQCVCKSGYEGKDCSTLVCLNECSKKGKCTDGNCICNEFWKGDDCSLPQCTDNCNNKGLCKEYNQCVCDAPNQGKFCEKRKCEAQCIFGTCDVAIGECKCEDGYHGENCGLKSCASPDCNNGGTCNEDIGKCVCDIQHSGADCEVVQCVGCDGYCIHDTFTNPSYHGSCVSNGCDLECDHGACTVDQQTGTNYCECEGGYSGDLCDRSECESKCQNGICTAANKCECLKDYLGEWCDDQQIDLKNVVIQTVEDQLEECSRRNANLQWFRFKVKGHKGKAKEGFNDDNTLNGFDKKQLGILSRFKFSKDEVKRCNQIQLLLNKFDTRKDKGEILDKIINNKYKKSSKNKGNLNIKKKSNSLKKINKDDGQIQKNKSDQKKIDLEVNNNYKANNNINVKTEFKSKNTIIDKIQSNTEKNNNKF